MNSTLFKFLVFLSLPYLGDAQDLLVANDKMNIFYAGVDNPVDFALKSRSSKNLTLNVDKGELVQVNGHLIYRFCTSKFEQITFSTSDPATKKILGKYTFRVILMPDPTKSE